jgi:hypothetical protein
MVREGDVTKSRRVQERKRHGTSDKHVSLVFKGREGRMKMKQCQISHGFHIVDLNAR